MASIEEFECEFTRAVIQGYASVFAGAGLSRASGHTNWKELIKPFAVEIGLDVEKEPDLVAVTQFYVNEKRNRASINQRILNEFTRDVVMNKNIEILTRLPLSTYWTTNYDKLIEQGLAANNRKVDVKTTQDSLTTNIYDRDAIVYKMHGDVFTPNTAVLTRDDYEMYGQDRPLFRTTLQGELINKTFLFIGFSFDDPNLNYILSQIRVLLGNNSREHYCFFEKVLRDKYSCDEAYHYDSTKQRLRIEDLRRYGIQAVELDSYSEITKILMDVEQSYLLNSVLISGSCEQPPQGWSDDSINRFVYGLAKMLVAKNYKVVSGFGFGIGSSVINGALSEISANKYKHIDEHLCLRPFPQNTSSEHQKLWSEYRMDLIEQVGVAIFVFGNKADANGNTVEANGMIEEFKIAKTLNKFIIPVGVTGGASAYIYSEMLNKKDDYPYLTSHWDKLFSETDINTLIELIFNIISILRRFHTNGDLTIR